MLQGQEHPRPAAGIVHRAAVHYGVWPGKVDVLKNAHGSGRLAAMGADGADALSIKDYNLPRFYVPDEGSACCIQGAAL